MREALAGENVMEAEMQKCVCGADVRWGLCDACEWKSPEQLPHPQPRISPELARKIAEEIDRKLIELGSSSPSVEFVADIIERVGNAE